MADPVLLFGGTFDPPHRAHVVLPDLVATRRSCRRIVYLPAARSPFKADETPTSDEHRLAMLRIALRDAPRAEVCTLELDRGGVSYFVDTLGALRVVLGPGVPLQFLIGADQAIAFHEWRDWRTILEMAEPVVVLRPPWRAEAFTTALGETYDAEETAQWLARIELTPLMDVSASEVRRRLAAGEPTDDVLDPAVAAYACEHGLYAT
jgi:nicotinate-nucleotide adenylyltransferase